LFDEDGTDVVVATAELRPVFFVLPTNALLDPTDFVGAATTACDEIGIVVGALTTISSAGAAVVTVGAIVVVVVAIVVVAGPGESVSPTASHLYVPPQGSPNTPLLD
jgi:hypothetical protein